MSSNPTGTAQGSLQEAANKFLGLTAAPAENEEPEEQPDEEEPEEIEAEGGDEFEDDSEDEAPTEPQRFKVRVDNEDVEVTLDELLNGYSRTADYTRKTQKLSEERKAFERDKQETLQLRSQYAEVLPQLRGMVENALGPEPDWDTLRKENPDQANWLWIQRQQAKEQLQQIRAQEQAERQALQAEQQRKMQAYIAQQVELVKQTMPDFEKEKGDMVAIARDVYGFHDQELVGLVDARMLRVLRDAALYNKSLQKAGKAKADQSKIRAAKPGAREQVPAKNKKRREQARQRLRETGHVRDAAAVFLELQG